MGLSDFDWDSPCSITGPVAADENAITPAFWYLMGRASCITNESFLTVENGDPHLEDRLILRDAVVSVTRFYESVESVAEETAEKLLAAVMETEQAQTLAAEADARKQEILNSQTTIVKSDTYI